MRAFVRPSRQGSLASMPSIGACSLIAVGAILKYAVSDSISGISLPTVGVILMVVGIVGLLLSLFWMFSAGRRGPDRVVDATATSTRACSARGRQGQASPSRRRAVGGDDPHGPGPDGSRRGSVGGGRAR